MEGSIALMGGDEFNDGCIEMDRHILDSVAKKGAPVLIVPTAQAANAARATADGVWHFSRLGARASGLPVLDATHANDEALCRQVFDASVAYFNGGSPDYLQSVLEGSLLLHYLLKALDRGLVVVGSSAGAMVLGSFLRRPSSQRWVRGLGVVEGVAVLPHHEGADPATVAETLARSAPPGLRVLGIDAMTCAFGTPGKWKVLGAGKVTVYEKGRWQAFNSGETLPEALLG